MSTMRSNGVSSTTSACSPNTSIAFGVSPPPGSSVLSVSATRSLSATVIAPSASLDTASGAYRRWTRGIGFLHTRSGGRVRDGGGRILARRALVRPHVRRAGQRPDAAGRRGGGLDRRLLPARDDHGAAAHLAD